MIKKLGLALFFCILIIPPSQCENNPSVKVDTGFNEIISQANLYLQQKNYAEAINKYDEALAIDNKSAIAYFNRGKAFFYSGDFVRAYDDFSATLALDSEYMDAYRYRGWANVAKGAFDLALGDFIEVVNLAPDMIDGYFGRGWCYLNKAQWDRSSLLYLYQRFESDSGLAEAYKGKSWHYVKEMQWDLSVVPDPAIAVEQTPDIDEVTCNRGFAFFKKAQWDAAVLDLEKEITFNPSLDRDKWNVDWAGSKKQEWDLAIADYNRIAELLGFDTKYVDIADDNLETLYGLAVEDYQYIVETSVDDTLVLKAEDALDYMANWRQDVGWQFVK